MYRVETYLEARDQKGRRPSDDLLAIKKDCMRRAEVFGLVAIRQGQPLRQSRRW